MYWLQKLEYSGNVRYVLKQVPFPRCQLLESHLLSEAFRDTIFVNILSGAQNIFVGQNTAQPHLLQLLSIHFLSQSSQSKSTRYILYPLSGLQKVARAHTRPTLVCKTKNIYVLWRKLGQTNCQESMTTVERRSFLIQQKADQKAVRPPCLFCSPSHNRENGVPKFLLLIFMKVFLAYHLLV